MVETINDGWGEENLVEGEQVALEVTPSMDMNEECTEGDFVVRITPPNSLENRVPIDLCCCVDISASMRSAATYEDENGEDVDEGLSILDIVKHAVKTIMHTLTDKDRMALVVFSDKAEKVFDLTEMNDQGRRMTTGLLEAQNPHGKTNLWGGLLASLDVLREGQRPGVFRKTQIMCLTDGMPTISPPRGHHMELRDYQDQFADFKPTINTFGFGYELDS
jgi:Mg-chelatase subunit ChlD